MAFIEQIIGHRHRTSSIGEMLGTRLAVWRTRRALARLDSHLLDDIGVTPVAARQEADLTVWDVPDSWTCR